MLKKTKQKMEGDDKPVLYHGMQKSLWGLYEYFFFLKVQIKCFIIAEFERAAKISKIAVYHFLISLLAPVITV